MATRTLSLFAGCGALDLAVRLALPDTRTVCYVERELSAARILAARIAEGSLDDAPIWSDIRTFDPGPWRGSVDCIAGGFPCQDISVAGRGEGIVEGNRSGLWFEFARLIREIRPRLVVLENVGAIVIRGLDTVLGDLAALGYDAEWVCLRASDVGASHRRERWFCVAYSADRGRGELREPSGCEGFTDGGECAMDDTSRHERPGSLGQDGSGWRVCATGDPMEDAGFAGIGRPEESAGIEGERASGDHCGAGRAVADAASPRLEEWGCVGGDSREERAAAERDCKPMADTSVRQFSVAGWRSERRDGIGSASAELPIFAPGPGDPRWPAILAEYPHLAPATESGIRGMVNGTPILVDASRTDSLRAIGNSVVPIQAAAAIKELLRRIDCQQ